MPGKQLNSFYWKTAETAQEFFPSKTVNKKGHPAGVRIF
jgi:hypothetical protein